MTDRYTKAIEQLGSEKLDVRIGGIYALERVARDSARDHPTVMEVLAAFIREHSREQWPPSGPGGQEQARPTPRADIQAAAVIGRRDRRGDIQQIDLSGADLPGANFSGADLTGADLSGADLSGADLSGADLSGADLTSRKPGRDRRRPVFPRSACTCVTSSLPPPAGRSCRCGVPASAGRRHKDRQHAQDVAGQTA